MHLAAFSEAFRAIQEYPFLPNVKRLSIRYGNYISSLNTLASLAVDFGRMLKSVGPLDVLSIYGCDPHIYLAPFLGLRDFSDMEHPIVYPPIKKLELSHLAIVHDKLECISAIVEFAKSQHERGIPFERLDFCMEKLPAGIEERLRPWVHTLDCYESLCEEFEED